jgi:hypothetical protein
MRKRGIKALHNKHIIAIIQKLIKQRYFSQAILYDHKFYQLLINMSLTS